MHLHSAFVPASCVSRTKLVMLVSDMLRIYILPVPISYHAVVVSHCTLYHNPNAAISLTQLMQADTWGLNPRDLVRKTRAAILVYV